MNTAYHFIGLDIHKHVVAFCTKRGDGETIGEGKFRANRAGMEDWAANGCLVARTFSTA